jgi:DNA-binding HxlR family transcriptional regulator
MRANTAKPKKSRRSLCPIAGALDVVGDKWSLLVVRDILHGKRTYGELCASPEGIPTNILAERLRRLEEAGIIARAAYHQRPTRYAYTLTAKGRELGGVLLALVGWGKRHIAGTRTLGEIATAAVMRTPARKPAPSRGTRGSS